MSGRDPFAGPAAAQRALLALAALTPAGEPPTAALTTARLADDDRTLERELGRGEGRLRHARVLGLGHWEPATEAVRR